MFVDEIKHAKLREWIEEMAYLMMPDAVYVCDGSKKEYALLAKELVKKGAFIKLKKRPNSYLCNSDPEDVARVEERTFICTEKEEEVGPTNHFMQKEKMQEQLEELFRGCMKGRVMYVIPFCMGPLGADLAMIGVQVTDSPYVVCNMHIMTRMGKKVLKQLGKKGEFIPCQHSIGSPLYSHEKDRLWPCNPKKTVIAHFPEERKIASFGSGYGGNALLGKKCLALRIASVKARNEKWLAEHMLIIKVTNPEGRSKFMAASFPSACGKTNLAMLKPTLKGWKIECVGDDIAWMKIGEEGRLYGMNPENGFFGVAPGTSMQSNPYCMQTIRKNTIFTNVALTEEGDVFWEGMTDKKVNIALDWRGHPYTGLEKAAHPNSRFTAPFDQCPIAAKEAKNLHGVPIDAIIFGGRRKDTIPLVYESFSWAHGVLIGSALSSETTAAAKGEVGKLRHDPFSMLPFCGYHMGDYFQHWLSFASYTKEENLPKIFSVNWFLEDEEGNYLWPGFGENSRVLKWIFEACDNLAEKKESPIGYVPTSLDLTGLEINPKIREELFKIDPASWEKELSEITDYFLLFGDKLPKALTEQIEEIKRRFLAVVSI